jgi:hypothetical protein
MSNSNPLEIPANQLVDVAGGKGGHGGHGGHDDSKKEVEVAPGLTFKKKDFHAFAQTLGSFK